MPPITIAFVDAVMSNETEIDAVKDYVVDNISKGYILDGMQRLNTLNSASDEIGFDNSRFLYVNIIIAERYDFLLYRMITLNNGQKPMTVRHQVEILTKKLIDRLSDDHSLKNIKILSEKETELGSAKGSFRMVDVAAAYLSFLTDSAHNQNARFIEEKLDEILVGKVMDSRMTQEAVSFGQVLEQADRLAASSVTHEWLRNENNLIGFTVGAKKAFDALCDLGVDGMTECVHTFDAAFQAINPSKVNVGKMRRDLVVHFLANIERLQNADYEALSAEFMEETAN